MYNNATQGRIRADVKSATEWREFIAAGRNKTERTVANNTTVRITGEGLIAIKLHNTDIVTIFSNGRVILNSGGWLSVTTKERINRFTNAGISQRKSIWYMDDGSLFYDGMTIRADGTPVKPRKPDTYEKKLKAIKKQARQYARDFVEALKAGLVDMPSGGDCWYCSMFDTNGHTTNAEHIRNHIKEKYYVPSLLVNAGRAAGYQDFQVGLMGIGGRSLFINPEDNIYKYVVKRLQSEL